MNQLYLPARGAALLGALALVVLPATGSAPRSPVHASRTTGCATMLGTYLVGPRIMPLRAPGGPQPPRVFPARAAQAQPTPGHGTSRSAIAWPVGVLRGTLVVSSYTGCGAATVGTFSVRRVPFGPPMERQQGSRSSMLIPCYDPCYDYAIGITSATGRFAQDPSHASDAAYVTVDATITSTWPGPQLGRPCSTTTGCPPPTTVRSTVTVTGITGYLQLTSGSPAATLSFLPPPSVYGNGAPVALVLQGWKVGTGTGTVPTPVPAP